jgi:hypothetical protein
MSIVSNHFPELLDQYPEEMQPYDAIGQLPCQSKANRRRLLVEITGRHHDSLVGCVFEPEESPMSQEPKQESQKGSCPVCSKTVPLDSSGRIKLHGPAPESTSAICPGSGTKSAQ